MVVLGTRPEAIKLLPVIQELRRRSVPVRVCSTGQHDDLLDPALTTELASDLELGVMQPGQSLGALTGRILTAVHEVLATAPPDTVIIQGDTATAVAAAQAAYLRSISVAHVEAGLRSGDLFSPHPEEGNRRMIAALADLHFAPTEAAAQALRSEGIDEAKIIVTGNTVVDALYAMCRRLGEDPAIAGVANEVQRSCGKRKLILVTCHRRESIRDLPEIAAAIRALAARSDVFMALPLHPNPAVGAELERALNDLANVALLPPLSFGPFLSLMTNAYVVLSDSGGVQEEAPVLGVPLLVMRDRTERPEGVAAGTARLVGTRARRIVAEASRVLDDAWLRARMARAHSPYGDGRAAERIVDVLAHAHERSSAKKHVSERLNW